MNAITKVEKSRAKKTATPQATSAIVPSAIVAVPLGRLKRAPENVRTTRIDEDIEPLADDIAAHGLLQSLIGYAGDTSIDNDVVYIAGGGRRLQALHVLLDRFAIDLEFPVPVLIRDRDEAVELSLAENLQKRDMNPADEFVAFAALMQPGTRSPADLAKRFGFTERYVKQRLKLAALAPEILDGLRAGDMTLQAALSYGRAADREVQLKVFKAQAKRSHDRHGVDRVRYDIDAQSKTTDWPLYRYVGANAYEREGGGYEDADLFGDDANAPRKLTNAFAVVHQAHTNIDFQMMRRQDEMARELDLDPAQVTSFVKLPDIEFGQHTMLYHLGLEKHAPDGYAFVGRDYDPSRNERMLKTIRNNRILVQLIVGVNPKGELVRFDKGVFVPKDQKNAVDQTSVAPPPPKRTQAEIDAEIRAGEIEKIAYRRGIGKFAGTPLEGRVFYPVEAWGIGAFEQSRDNAKAGRGKLVTVQVWVTNEQAEAELAQAERDYDQQLKDEAEARERKEREAAERKAAIEKREAELRAMDPPAIAVIDGDVWARDEDGAYAVIGEENDSFVDDWQELLENVQIEDVGETYADRADFDAAMKPAADTDEVTA